MASTHAYNALLDLYSSLERKLEARRLLVLLIRTLHYSAPNFRGRARTKMPRKSTPPGARAPIDDFEKGTCFCAILQTSRDLATSQDSRTPIWYLRSKSCYGIARLDADTRRGSGSWLRGGKNIKPHPSRYYTSFYAGQTVPGMHLINILHSNSSISIYNLTTDKRPSVVAARKNVRVVLPTRWEHR